MHELVSEFIQCLSQLLLRLFLLGLEARLVGLKFRGLLEVVQRLAQLHGLLFRLRKGGLLLLKIPFVFVDLGHAAVDFLAGALSFLMVWGLLQSMINLFTRHSQERQFFLGDGNLFFESQEGLSLFYFCISQTVLGFFESFLDLGIARAQLLAFFQL